MSNLTPAMQQYMDIKAKHKDAIVFFRMGDFYETFYEDAKITSKVLDIALTKRGIKNSESEIPLAGIPYHALDSYLYKMVKEGLKVAIVEQLEDPKYAKGVVKRDVTRVVTPGALIDQKLLSKSNNYIASVFISKKTGIALIDISTSEFLVFEHDSINQALEDIKKYSPSEILLPVSFEKTGTASSVAGFKTFKDDFYFHLSHAKETLFRQLKVLTLDGFGLKEKESAICAAGALVSYLHETQKNSLEHINTIIFVSQSDNMSIDSSTLQNLEILGNENSLLKTLDYTNTAMGSRFFKKNLINPLMDVQKINERLFSVEELMKKPFILNELREIMKNISDLERLISRINCNSSSPKDLAQLQGSLELIPELKKILMETSSKLLENISRFEDLTSITGLIERSIKDDPPAFIDEGNFIKEGFNEELDSIREISENAKNIILEIEQKERERTKIKSLKIRFNRVFGYYIDITKTNASLVPNDYIKKQTLANSERFITPELKELEEKILNAEEKIISLEKELFLGIIETIKSETKKIQENSRKLAYLDFLCSLAKASLLNHYVKPLITNNYKIILKKSRHPVVEKLTDFVTNDLFMDENSRTMIITGPNMAGKSVFMKQVALNVIMAQIGCFVACDYAEISLVDRIFSRLGASDDISRGQSTFMVEMSETAMIINMATEKSLIILDEIGRGTSTYDGVAIAWAVAEHITRKIRSKTLFATHYHSLNSLEKEIEGVKNFNIAVEENEHDIIFLRKIVPGGTDKSYGITVAKLSGMPKEIIERSREIQFKLEKDDEISERIIVETRKTVQKDYINEEIEETERLIKSRQLRLDEL